MQVLKTRLFLHLFWFFFFFERKKKIGHYVPAISERILVGNKKRSGVHINMQGLA